MKKLFYFFMAVIFTLCAGNISANRTAFLNNLSDKNLIYKNAVNRRVEGNQSTLWTPVSTFEDGAVYMIRSVENANLYWDLTGGNLTNGTEVQLYNLNYSHAQKFYFKKQFDVCGYPTYRLAPLYNYDKVLRTNSASDDEVLHIDDERYSDTHLFSDKLCFVPSPNNNTQFNILTCFNNSLDHILSVNSVSSGQKIKQKTKNVSNFNLHTWEIVKTDYMGLNVGNKTYINGLNEFRYVARVPFTGKYVIEVRTYNSTPLTTVLRLVRDSDNTQVAQSSTGGVGGNALITYSFSTIEEFSVLIRGYFSSTQGYCYVILRPQKSIYMTGTYDIDNQHCDRVSALNNSKSSCRSLGYFPEIYANLNHNRVFNDTDWEDKKKIDRDYYLFYGHGGNDGTAAAYFDGENPDWAYYYDLPNFICADLIIWMICNGGNYDPSNNHYHCMARDTVIKGADRSVGFKGEIYNLTCDKFIPKLFEVLNSNLLEDALPIASQYAINSNWLWWVFYGQYHCDINNPILFTSDNKNGIGFSTNTIETSKTENYYINEEGFIRKKSLSFKNISTIYKSIYEKKQELEKDWDDVLLFLDGDDNTPKIIAMCSDTSSCFCKYVDVKSGETIEPECFERIMKCNEN